MLPQLAISSSPGPASSIISVSWLALRRNSGIPSIVAGFTTAPSGPRSTPWPGSPSNAQRKPVPRTSGGWGRKAGRPKVRCIAWSIWWRSRTFRARRVRQWEMDAMVLATSSRCRGLVILLVSM